jgi:hypothetical protein
MSAPCHSSSRLRASGKPCSSTGWVRFLLAAVRTWDSLAAPVQLERCNVRVPGLQIVRAAMSEIGACRTRGRMRKAVRIGRPAIMATLRVSRSVAPARLLPRRTAENSGPLRLRAQAIVRRVGTAVCRDPSRSGVPLSLHPRRTAVASVRSIRPTRTIARTAGTAMLRGQSHSAARLSPRLRRTAVASVRSIRPARTIARTAGTAMLRGRSHSAARASQLLRRIGVASARSILLREARPRVAGQPAAVVAIGTAAHQVPARSAVTRKLLAADRHGHNSTCVSQS